MGHVSSTESFRFGPFELNLGRGVLLRDGDEVALPRKSFELLVQLVRGGDRVVPKGELLAAVWPEVVVSDAAFASALRDLRRALDDVGGDSRLIESVRGRGLRITCPVEAVPDDPQGAGGAWETMAVHFERALEALDQMDASRGEFSRSRGGATRERGDLLVALARARWAAGATMEARDAFLAAAEAARRADDAEMLGRAALGFVGRTDVTPGVNREAVELIEDALRRLPERDDPLRAELLARLGTELYYDDDRTRSDRATREALAMAERIGEPSLEAYTSTARHFILQRPEIGPELRLPLVERAIGLMGEAPPSDVLALALQGRILDLLELGEGERLRATFAEYQALVDALGLPFFEWIGSFFAGMFALLDGRIEEAERRAHATAELGRRIGSPNAEGVLGGQLFGIRRAQGRLGELAPAMEALAEQHEALPIYRAGWAATAAAAGSGDPEAVLEEVFAHDLEDFPRDQNWVASLGTLAPAVATVGSEARVRQMLGLMEPYAGRMIVVGAGATCHGAASHHLALLHAAIGERAQAARRFDEAEALHERAVAPLWTEETRRARARLEIPE